MRPTVRTALRRYLRPVAVCALAVMLTACGGDDDDGDDDTSNPPSTAPEAKTPDSVRLSLLGRFATGRFNVGASEITAFDPATKRGFVVNAQKGTVEVLNMADPANPQLIDEIDASGIIAGAEINSVSVRDGIVAAAIQAPDKTDPGAVGLYDAKTLAELSHVAIGSLPDMITFTPDGKYVLVANEGEPNDDYSVDPEGSVSVIDVTDPGNPVARIADFHAWNGKEQELRNQGVRIFGPGVSSGGAAGAFQGASASQDFEPEYIAISADSATAWVTLQENNALAVVDIAQAKVTGIKPLGYKDLGQAANALDASDEDGRIDIRPRPGVLGMYMPDSIASYSAGGKTYLVTANEGDSRAWGEDDDDYWAGDASKGFVEEFRAKHLVHRNGFVRRRGDDLPPQLDQLAAGAMLNPDTFAYCGATAGDPGDCTDDDELGRLNVTWTLGFRTDPDTGAPIMFNDAGAEDPAGTKLMYDHLYAFGGRSFSIRDEDGALVWDSGGQFEAYLASDACRLGKDRQIPCKDFFNSGHDEGDAFDSRSDAKGPEPEGIEIGKLGDKTFAFIGLERMGGVMVYDITDPEAPKFADYFNTREDWTTEDPEDVLDTVGDLGPEGIRFIAPDASPTGEALLMVGHEVSGSTAIYTVNQLFDDK